MRNVDTQVRDQIQSLIESHHDLYRQLYQQCQQKELEKTLCRQVESQIQKQKAEYERQQEIAKNLSEEFNHWNEQANNLRAGNRALSDRIKRLRSSMAMSPARSRPPLKKIPNRSLTEAMKAAPAKRKLDVMVSDETPPGTRSQAIFEEFFVISSDLSNLGLGNLPDESIRCWQSTPGVWFRYGLSPCLALDPAQVVAFVCPSGRVQLRAGTEGPKAAEHDFVFATQLTTADQELVQMYGVCIIQSEIITIVNPRSGRQIRLHADVRYCLTTRYPLVDFHIALIHNLIAVRQRFRLGDHSVQIVGPNLSRSLVSEWDQGGSLDLLHQISRASVPAHDQQLRIESCLIPGPVLLMRPAHDSISIVTWAARKVLGRISARILMQLIEAVLREMSIIIVGQDLGQISAWALYLTAAIHPLQWVGVFLPVLPDRLADFLQSPVPIIAGVRYLPDSMQSQSGFVIWRPESNQVWTEDPLPQLTDPGLRCEELIKPLMETGVEQMIMERLHDTISQYIIDMIEKSKSDPAYIYYQQTQIMTHYIHTHQ